jgi:hypothetical protein
MTAKRLSAAFLASVLPLGAALAIQQPKSLYTAVDLSACAALRTGEGGGPWICDGLEGYPVYLAQHDRRTYLSVGPKADEMRAAKQTLGASNTPFEGHSARMTVEWRFVIREGRPAPYATIIRYFTDTGTERGEVLVVMRVMGTEVCHVAYVDALANPDAIVLARRVADKRARLFSCGSEPFVEGARGKSPM